ncbi:MAG: hypothetical protein ACREEX_13705, partial [Caulobacteraceae bacterium]
MGPPRFPECAPDQGLSATVRQALAAARQRLEACGVEGAARDARLLLECAVDR